MSRVLVTGGAGLVGRYIVEDLLAHGYQVRIASRTPPPPGWFPDTVGHDDYALDPETDATPLFRGVDHLVHAAFSHVPGRYRGGEGVDPDGFRRANLDATVRLFETARRAGIRRAVFLSSRAVYDGLPSGTRLCDDMALAPTSLYGEIKLKTEQALTRLSNDSFVGISLRATGVYGDLVPGKWDGLFADYLAGRPIPVHAGSEVHGRDVGRAVRLMLEADQARVASRAFNLSDIIVDTRDILEPLQRLKGCPHPLPASADKNAVAAMTTEPIEALGWTPGGEASFQTTVRSLVSRFVF